jgi:hypothetical protein
MIMEWNVAFKVLRGGAGLPIHVSAVGYDPEGGVYVMVDPHRFAIEVRALSPAEFDRWAALQFMLGGEVYRIAAREDTPLWFPGLWCVGVVKRLVGLRSGALSPGGLRRDLVRAGAQRVFTRESQNPSPNA